MGKENAEAYGKRNTNEDEVLVRVKPTKILAGKTQLHGNDNYNDDNYFHQNQHICKTARN